VGIPDLKYTDEDVRRDSELQRRAESYALHYLGDFAFLARARAQVEANGHLTVGVARGVLNCMRLDPRISATLPPPECGEREDSRTRARRQLRVAPITTRTFVPVKVWHKPYLMSTHPSAQLIHKVDTGYSGHVYWYEDGRLKDTRSQVRAECTHYYSRTILLSLGQVEDRLRAGQRLCRRCIPEE
jgi:hypothetical protein